MTQRWRWGRALLALEYGMVFLLTAGAIVIGPYFLLMGVGHGLPLRAALLLGAGLLLAWMTIGPLGARWQALLGPLAGKLRLVHVALAGVAAQLLVAWITQPVPNSDGLTYLQLAQTLVAQSRYVDDNGARAFWPAGFPLFLSPFVAVFGAGLAAVVAANIVLYLVGVVSVWTLGAAMFERRVAALAALLFTVWPSRLLTAGVASKENLTIAGMLAGSALCVLAFRNQTGRAWALAAAAGAAFGVATMAQPGLLLFLFSIPLCYRYACGARVGRFLALCGVVLAAAMVILAPWHIRNCVLFDGQFCGLATNGGSVFYRANNPMANGGWTPEAAIPIMHLPELEQNRLGFEYGKQWIAEHPGQFLALAGKKLSLLLRDDGYGAYWGIFRGLGHDHERTLQSVTAARTFWYYAAHVLSWAFWIVIVACVARASLARAGRKPLHLPLVYPMLYAAAVFTVFESDRRQHMIALALMIVLAAAAMLRTGGPATATVRVTATTAHRLRQH